MCINKLPWDGYIHINGKLIVKRMWGKDSSIEKDSPFVYMYVGPVEARNREEAVKLLEEEVNMIKGKDNERKNG